MKRGICLVSGGAGFIGSHLCDELIKQGQRVIAVDNLITGIEKNLDSARKNSNFQFIKHDVTLPLQTSEKIDFVFHLASPASVPDYQKHPLETAHVNSVGTEYLLLIAKKHNARFLFTSTSEVYGDPKEHPQKESYWGNVNSVGPRACYDESKRYGEMMVTVYRLLHGLDARIVRIFNTYGPRMRKNDGRVISNFASQAIRGLPITVYGDGTQTRSFCYIDDMVSGLIAMMDSEKAGGEVVNLGNPLEFTMIALAEKIKTMTESKSEIVFKPLPVDDPRERRPDITKAKTLLTWEPKVSVEEGIARTLEYYRKER